MKIEFTLNQGKVYVTKLTNTEYLEVMNLYQDLRSFCLKYDLANGKTRWNPTKTVYDRLKLTPLPSNPITRELNLFISVIPKQMKNRIKKYDSVFDTDAFQCIMDILKNILVKQLFNVDNYTVNNPNTILELRHALYFRYYQCLVHVKGTSLLAIGKEDTGQLLYAINIKNFKCYLENDGSSMKPMSKEHPHSKEDKFLLQSCRRLKNYYSHKKHVLRENVIDLQKYKK